MKTQPMSDSNQSKRSKLHIYSLGKAAENKPLSENRLMVIPIEHLMLLDGELKSEPTENEKEGVDATGQHYSVSATTDNAIEADWLPYNGGYQMTAPDVRRDERVLIWRFADSDEFYWTPLGLDNHLRKLETMSFMVSGTRDEEEEELSPDNSYVFTISTHEGHISLTTSKANEEATCWAMQFNTKDGRFLLTEENGNEVEIHGIDNYISLLNADKTHVELDRRDIRIFCENDFRLEAQNSIYIKTKTFTTDCDTYTLNCESSYELNCQTMTVNADSSVKINTANLTVKSDSNTFDTPNSTFTGSVECDSLNATSAAIGGVTISSGNIQCNTVNASVAVNAPNL